MADKSGKLRVYALLFWFKYSLQVTLWSWYIYMQYLADLSPALSALMNVRSLRFSGGFAYCMETRFSIAMYGFFLLEAMFVRWCFSSTVWLLLLLTYYIPIFSS